MRFIMMVLAGLCWASAATAAEQELDRAGWSADLAALKDALSERYANLEWAVERRMDLPAAARRAQARLDAATTEYEARQALERLVGAFGDGHLELSWPGRPRAGGGGAAGPRPLCEALGMGAVTDDYAVGPHMPGYAPLDPDQPTAAGIVTVDGRKVGIIRIERFAPAAVECAQALEELKIAADGACDEACQGRVSERADLLFVRNIGRRVDRLSGADVDLLLVDLTRNGGGNDSAIALARLFGGDLPSPRVARMRDPALAQNLADKRQALSDAAADRRVFAPLIEALRRAEAEASKPCDRRPLWDGKPIACSALVQGPFYAGGLSPKPWPTPLTGDVREIVYAAARYAYTPGAWRGRLAVLIDGDTASSAELFTAMLQDAQRATVIGAPSVGAGCGWMLPVRPVTLPHSKGELRMPDCVRYRADGTNEVDAIRPDIAAHIRPSDTPYQRAARVRAVLPQALAAPAPRR